MSGVAQASWSLLLPILAFGDQALDFWFLIGTWDSFAFNWLKWACLSHLICLSIIELAFGFWSYYKIQETKFVKSTGFHILWTVLSFLNLNEFYVYWTKKEVCKTQFCGGRYRNEEFQKQIQDIFLMQFAIHTFGEDLVQLILQMYQLSYSYDPSQTQMTAEVQLNIVSVLFGWIFLFIGILYFIVKLFMTCCECSCDCQCSLTQILIGQFMYNKAVKPIKHDTSMVQIKGNK